VIALGFPLPGLLASDVNVSLGTVSALSGLANDSSKLQISAPIQPGNSGGPLLDHSGNVVGVVVSKLDALQVAKITGDIPQNINFAVKGELAQVFLRAQSISFATAKSVTRLPNEEIAVRGRAFTVQVECDRAPPVSTRTAVSGPKPNTMNKEEFLNYLNGLFDQLARQGDEFAGLAEPKTRAEFIEYLTGVNPLVKEIDLAFVKRHWEGFRIARGKL
jgi:hypothetical protein